jgi:hypothetical protein
LAEFFVEPSALGMLAHAHLAPNDWLCAFSDYFQLSVDKCRGVAKELEKPISADY